MDHRRSRSWGPFLQLGLPLLTALQWAAVAREAEAQCGADLYGSNTQVGGGSSYTDLLNRADAEFFVDTRAELVTALANAQSGDMIWIEWYANIDLLPPGLPPEQWQLTIPAGVTLASNRGPGSIGGRLFVDAGENGLTKLRVFRVTGPGVRISGLRLSGSDTAVGSETYVPETTDGVIVEDQGTLEVDNCELSGWTHGAIYAVGTVVDVHHNHIHHNRRTGLGYGVVLGEDAYALIESNVFDHNRHDIAGTGDPRQSYTARYNLVVGEGTSHAFDMHGEGERAGTPSGFAGAELVIEHNTFVDDGERAVTIRGAPYVFGYVDHNIFTHTLAAGSSGAVRQIMHGQPPRTPGILGAYDEANPGPMPATPTNGFQRMRQSSNCVDYAGWFRYEPRFGGFYPLATSSYGVSSLAFGRFNLDPRADVFRTNGTHWFVSYGATQSWVQLTTTAQPYPLSSLVLGNFVGDSRTDVFRTDGTRWHASDAGNGTWTQLASSGIALSQLRFGNFVGDSRTDVFRVNGNRWEASDAGASNWQPLATLSVPLSELAFGNFVGDSRTDVFRATGSQWQASDAGVGNWQSLASSSYTLSELAFADVIGDSRTDVLRSSGDTWYVSDGGATGWQVFASFAHGSYPLSAMRFADINGDGKSDVFISGKP